MRVKTIGVFDLNELGREKVVERRVSVSDKSILIVRRVQQECGCLPISVSQVQTTLSPVHRVIITGKSLHDQSEAGLSQMSVYHH